MPKSGVANLAGERLLLSVNGGYVLLHEALGGGRVAALVAVVGPVLEVHGVHVDVEVDLLPESPLAHLAGERPLLLVHQVNVLVETRLARALVLANRASGGNRSDKNAESVGDDSSDLAKNSIDPLVKWITYVIK